MNKGTIISIIVIAALLLIGVFAYMFSQQTSTNNAGGSLVNQPSSSSNTESNSPSTSQSTPQSKDIVIQNFAFSPSTINIKAGDSITWTNQDSAAHTVTSDSGSELDSELLSQGDAYSHTFDTPGTYPYHCTPHPGMKAKVIVS